MRTAAATIQQWFFGITISRRTRRRSAAAKILAAGRFQRLLTLPVLLAVALVGLGGVYVWQVNGVTAVVYRKEAMEQRRRVYQAELERLQLRLTELQSPDRLAEMARRIGLQNTSVVEYVGAEDRNVAAAQGLRVRTP